MTGFVLSLPAIALFAVFMIAPIATAVQYSTTKTAGYGYSEPVGIANYVRAFSDPELLISLGRTFAFAAMVVAGSVIFGFLLAYVLLLKIPGWRFLQVGILVPFVAPLVVTAILWQFLLDPQFGLLNSAFRAIGLNFLTSTYLTSADTALASVALVQVWAAVPLNMLLMFGAMLSVSPALLEAAALDGAGHIRKMRHVIVPGIRPVIILVAFFQAISVFRSFDVILLLTKGGPLSSTTTAPMYLYTVGFRNGEYGYANALGIIIGITLAIVAATPRVIAAVRSRQGVARELAEASSSSRRTGGV